MMRRREFLQSAAAACWCLGYAPRLGEILFCRVSHDDWLPLAPRGCIVEVDPAAEGLTMMGTKATIVVNQNGWRIFPASEKSAGA